MEKTNSPHLAENAKICGEEHPRDALSALHQEDEDHILRLADLFKVLGDRTRIKIISLLAAKEEMCVCDIAETLSMGQSAISHQLRVLRTSRLVKFRKDGKEAFYSLDDDHVLGLVTLALEHIRHD